MCLLRKEEDLMLESSSKNLTIAVITPVMGRIRKEWLSYLQSILPENSKIILVGNITIPIHSSSDKIVILSEKCNRSKARNLGLLFCNEDLVFFLDFDQLPSKELLKEAITVFREGYEVIKIPERFIGRTLWGKASALWKASVQMVDRKYGCIPRIYSRRLLLEVGGFDKELNVLEDFELYLRIKAKCVKEAWTKSPIYHFESNSLIEILKKSRFYIDALSSKARRTISAREVLRKYLKSIKVFVHAMASKESMDVKLCCVILNVIKMVMLIFQIISSIVRQTLF